MKNKQLLIIIGLIAVFFFALILRLHNLVRYTTWWADDGGAHIAYVDVMLEEGRLPTPDETYLAWHEPGYYLLVTVWDKIGELVYHSSLNWWELLQVLMFLDVLTLIGLISYWYTKDTLITGVQLLLFSSIFVGVKLSAYVTNELLGQFFILGLVFLFIYWNLHKPSNKKHVAIWAACAAVGTLVKLTVIIPVIAALFVWAFSWVRSRSKDIVVACLIVLGIIGVINAPWFAYKQSTFDSSFSINLYEHDTKQSLVASDGWKHLGTVSKGPFSQQPYWEHKPWSFASILVADTFADHYNLFNHVDEINSYPEKSTYMTSNGRYTTPELASSVRWASIVGLILMAFWSIGFVGWGMQALREKKITGAQCFLALLVLGGIGALVYNTLRLPYYDRGVLKAQFVFFFLPIFSLIAYSWWARVITNRAVQTLAFAGPVVLYIAVALPMLLV